jgi:hypothetical protein
VFHHTPESKQQLMEWHHTHSALKKKFKTWTSTNRVIATVFWDRKGVLMVNCMPHGTTVSTVAYCETQNGLDVQLKTEDEEWWQAVFAYCTTTQGDTTWEQRSSCCRVPSGKF